MAAPFTAAITGTGTPSWARAMASNTLCCSAQASSVMPLRSFRSAPAWKCLPSPVRITQRRSARAARPVQASVNSSPIRVDSALATSGRLKATTATPGAGSVSRIVSGI